MARTWSVDDSGTPGGFTVTKAAEANACHVLHSVHISFDAAGEGGFTLTVGDKSIPINVTNQRDMVFPKGISAGVNQPISVAMTGGEEPATGLSAHILITGETH